MGSHRDEDSLLTPKFLQEMREVSLGEAIREREQSLLRRMENATEHGSNLITAGVDREQVLFDQVARGVLVRRLPDDPDGVLRVSLGCPTWDSQQAYCVVRGDPPAVCDLLRRSLKVFQSMLPSISKAMDAEENER